MERLRLKFVEYKDKSMEYKREFIGLFGIYLLAFSAIIRANYTYADDIGRTFAGYHGWLDWSRSTTVCLCNYGSWRSYFVMCI